MNLVFVDENLSWKSLLPLTYTKPIAELRVGIVTLRQKWEHFTQLPTAGFYTEKYLSAKYPTPSEKPALYINSIVIPTEELASEIKRLQINQKLMSGNTWIAFKGKSLHQLKHAKSILSSLTIKTIHRPWDLVALNATEIEADFKWITANQTSAAITDKNTITYGNAIFIEEGAEVRAAVLNSEKGPIYIGKRAKIHEGALIKGPFAICTEANVAMGAKVREGCTIGIKATGGGELKNSIIGDYSNKGHDGYLGDSILGNWCNLGALTNVSNLKNTYSNIKAWDASTNKFIDIGTNKFGCVLGDYTHTGISTLLNTGTVIAPFCQLFGTGLHPKFVSAYQWGEPNQYVTYDFNKALKVAQILHSLKKETFTEKEEKILRSIYEMIKS